MKNFTFLAGAMLFVLCIGCSKDGAVNFSDRDNNRTSPAAIVCNPPYIRYTIDCCVDVNNNSICDKEEPALAQNMEPAEAGSHAQTSEGNDVARNLNASSDIDLASASLSAGTRIIDRVGDWVSTGNPEDNPSPYYLDFADILEVDVGIDDTNLYVKTIFNSKWPTVDGDWPSFNSDLVTDVGFSVMIDSDNNPNTGCQSDGGTEITLEYGKRINVTYGKPAGTWNGYKTGPSGIEMPEEKRYLNDYDINGPMIGGPGYDYVLGIYPLNDLKLRPGQVVALKIKAEAKSTKYHHATFDDMNFLNGLSKSSIVIKLGEKKTINLA